MKTLSTFLLASSITLPAIAQVLAPTPQANPFSGGNSTSSSEPTSATINRHQSSSSSVQGEEIPIIDPTAKTLTFQGRSYSLMDNNLGGQFEAYLASTDFESSAAVSYRAKIDKILELLSPLNTGGPNLKEAYTLLEDASEYQGDGGICDSLANSVYSGLLVVKGVGNKKEAIEKLDKESRRIVYNLGVLESKKELGETTTVKQGNKTTTTVAEKSSEYLAMQKRLLEIEAIKKKYEASGVISVTQSKVQYQAMMVQLFMQRRFQHVVMAARFYNEIYKDGDQNLRLKKDSDTEKFFSEGLGVNPTVSGLDAAANEAMRKAKTLVSAFQNNLKSGRIHAASERLVEAYAIGEFMPCVQTINMEDKGRIQQYIQDANDLVEALSAKELGRATELNDSLKKQASDYNPSKTNAYIAGHKRASDGYVRDARFALFEKDTARSKVAIENAVKFWPSNPAIEDFNNDLDKILLTGQQESDTLTQTVKEFDRLLADKNYRAIVEEPRKSTFVVVLGQLNDRERLATLDEIAKSILEIEKALEKSNGLVEADQYYAAWEAISETQAKYYDDPKIANARAQLIGKVGNFTAALSKAEQLEKSDLTPQSGSALSWYLKAREIYPQSKLAKEGIQRIVNKQFRHYE